MTCCSKREDSVSLYKPLCHQISLPLLQCSRSAAVPVVHKSKVKSINKSCRLAVITTRERDVAPWYKCSLMVRWVVRSILHGVDPLIHFSFNPVLKDWCKKGCGDAYKRILAANWKE